MGLMQLINVILFWVFFGSLSAYLGKQRGRSSLLWFFIGLFLGVFGVLLAVILPRPKQKATINIQPVAPKRSDAWLKRWYYLDPSSRQQQGPFEFPEFAKLRKEAKLTDVAYIWGEGMQEWKRLSEMPELLSEME